MERRISECPIFGLYQHLEPARFVKPCRLDPWISDRNRQAAYFQAYTKPMLFVGGVSDGDLEFATLLTAISVDSEHIALIAVVSLIERPHEPDAGLDGDKSA